MSDDVLMDTVQATAPTAAGFSKADTLTKDEACEAPSLSLRRRYHPAKPKKDEWLFLLECESANLFRRIVDILLLQMSEINFEISETGLHILGMESSQIALVDFMVTRKNFSVYSLQRPCTVGISLQLLRDMLKQAGPDDYFRFYQDSGSSQNVHLEFFSKKLVSSRLAFSWRPLDIESDVVQAPNHLAGGKPTVTLPGWRFKELMSDFKNLSDCVQITLNRENLTWHIADEKRILYLWIDQRTDVIDPDQTSGEAVKIETDATATGDMSGQKNVPGSSSANQVEVKLETPSGSNNELPSSRVKLNPGDGGGSFRGWRKTFGLKHLNIFAQASSLAGDMKIWFSGNHPACFHYDLEGDSEYGWARFWLAAYAEPAAGQ